MIIAHVHVTFHPVLGGLERVIQRLAEEQTKLGHEVHVITSMYGVRGRPREELLNNVYVHRIKAWKLGYPDIMIPREYPLRVLKQVDLVHLHSQNSFFDVKVAEKAKHYGAKVAAYFMAVNSLSTHPNLIKRVFGYWYQQMATRKTIVMGDLKLVGSLRDKHVLKEKYGIDAAYVPYGIDEEYLRRPKDPDSFRRKFNIEDDHIFLYIGRLHPAKGPQILIKAAALLRKHIKESFKVVIIGPGSKDWLTRLARKLNIEKQVVMMGFMPEDVKISAIDASSCVVVPSLYDYVEVFSLVASEAWARRKPVVAFAVGELVYRVKHGVNGLLVKHRNSRDLALTLQELVTGKHNFKIDEKLYTWKEVALELVKFYNAVA